ncbi:MAG: RNA-guided endonuclease InsQ/TnpB family protein [Candidatus Sericytochromatia bacterium]
MDSQANSKKVRKTFKYKAVVSKTTAAHAEQWLWRCQQLYNLALEQRVLAYKQFGVNLNYNAQSAELPTFKREFPEFAQVGSQVLQDVLERLEKAFQHFYDNCKKGEKGGFPRFKARSRYDSFTLKTSGWKLNENYLTVSKVGVFKLNLSRPIEGKIKTVSIHRDSYGDWWVCFSCIVEAKKYPEPFKGKVGIDVGLKHFCVDSDPDSQAIANPRYYRKLKAKLRRQQRVVSRRNKGSNRRRKAVKHLAKTHRQIANMRLDFLHKVANHYVLNYSEIHVESLKIRNMVKNRHLSMSIQDASWGLFFELLEYKAAEAGRQLVKVNPRGTSQKCSGCGEIVPKTLAVRIHSCKACGLDIDRDENAARNIKAG